MRLRTMVMCVWRAVMIGLSAYMTTVNVRSGFSKGRSSCGQSNKYQ
jgi:hypothetical protein